MNKKATDVIGYQIKSLIVLTCMGLLAFLATFHSPFHYDDAHAIVENPYIQKLDGFQKSVGIENIFNRSVLLLTFAANREIGQLNVFGYHLTNILIHILTGIVWYFLVSELLLLDQNRKRLKRLPLICASIHLLSPLTVETVTYISSRSSGLATFFYLSTFYIFCRLVRPRKKHLSSNEKLIFIIGILVVFFLGIGAKEIVITFPLIAIIPLAFFALGIFVRLSYFTYIPISVLTLILINYYRNTTIVIRKLEMISLFVGCISYSSQAVLTQLTL